MAEPLSIEEVFGLANPDPVAERLEGVRRALEAHSQRKPKPFEKTVSLNEFLGIGGGEPEPERAKRTDLNEPARKWLKEMGWDYERVDYYDPRTCRSHDLLGMFDYLAFTPDGETVGVQITSRSQMSERRKKILAHPRLPHLRRCGWKPLVLGFDKHNGRWRCKEEWV